MTATRFFSKDSIVAPPGFNRWRIPPASIAIHLCIGSAYAWSIFNPPLVKVKGVVASAAEDWNLSQVVWIFTVAIVFVGTYITSDNSIRIAPRFPVRKHSL